MIKKIKNIKTSKKFKFYLLLGIVFLFFLWWLIAFLISSRLFPTPIEVFPVFFSYLGKSITYQAIGGTFLRILISFAISLVLGGALGIIAGHFYRFEAFIKPLITVLKTLPTAAVVLVLVVLLKPMWLPIIVTTLVMLPLFYEAFLNGIKNMNKDIKDRIKIDGVNPLNSLFTVYVPTIAPYILLAVVQSLGLGMKVSIMAEIVGGSNQIIGLGRLIHASYINAESVNVIALSLVAILIIIIIDIAMSYVKKEFKNGKK